ncbi:hypothetical protein ABZ826_36920 [Streptomyces sp. NPDC047515]|uniref:hypothetical protein n=1 Tax=Streptomyces sp. NPDC047515 TaxID=3155380 RepID=UPI0033C3D343
MFLGACLAQFERGDAEDPLLGARSDGAGVHAGRGEPGGQAVLDQRATTLTALGAALARDAGAQGPAIDGRAALLRTEITTAGVTAAAVLLDLALALHHTVRGDDAAVRNDIARLEELTRSGDYAYYTDIAHFLAGLPLAGALAGWRTDHPAAVAGPGYRPARPPAQHPMTHGGPAASGRATGGIAPTVCPRAPFGEIIRASVGPAYPHLPGPKPHRADEPVDVTA